MRETGVRLGLLAALFIAPFFVAPAPAGAVSAGPVTGIPGGLKSDVSARVSSCRPHAHSKHLLSARVTVTATGRYDLVVRGMECGAHDPRTGQVLFSNPTDPLNKVPAGKSRSLDVVFPFDAKHDQCRCRIRKIARVGGPKAGEDDARKKAEEERKRKEAEARKRAEEEKRRAEADRKAEEKRRAEADRKAEEKRRADADRSEEERRRADAERKEREEEERRRAEAEREEEERRRAEAESTPAPTAEPWLEPDRPDGPHSEWVAVPISLLRGGPALASGVIVELEAGTKVTVEYLYAGWAYVSVASKGHSGWVSSDELLPNQQEAVRAARAVEKRERELAEARRRDEEARRQQAAVREEAPEPEPEAEPDPEPEPEPEPEVEREVEPDSEPEADEKKTETAEAAPPPPPEEEEPKGLCETVQIFDEFGGVIDRVDGQKRCVYVSDLWYALPTGKKKGLVAYMNECLQLPTVRDSVTDEELARYALTGISIYQ